MKKKSLEELLSQCKPENRHEEVDCGAPVGKEFLSEEWQKGEREEEEDIRAGRVKSFNNIHDLIADLESEKD